MANRNFNDSGPNSKEARSKRVKAAKEKINKLVDKGVKFNPQKVSEHTIDRAAGNLTASGQGVKRTRIRGRLTTSESAGKTKKKKK